MPGKETKINLFKKFTFKKVTFATQQIYYIFELNYAEFTYK